MPNTCRNMIGDMGNAFNPGDDSDWEVSLHFSFYCPARPQSARVRPNKTMTCDLGVTSRRYTAHSVSTLNDQDKARLSPASALSIASTLSGSAPAILLNLDFISVWQHTLPCTISDRAYVVSMSARMEKTPASLLSITVARNYISKLINFPLQKPMDVKNRFSCSSSSLTMTFALMYFRWHSAQNPNTNLWPIPLR